MLNLLEGMRFVYIILVIAACSKNVRTTSDDSGSISDNIQFHRKGYDNMVRSIPLYNIQSDQALVTATTANAVARYDDLYKQKIATRQATVNYMNSIAASTNFKPAGIVHSVESVPVGNITYLKQRIDSNKTYKSDIDIDEIGFAMFLHDATVKKRQTARKIDVIEDPYILASSTDEARFKVLGDEFPNTWKAYGEVSIY